MKGLGKMHQEEFCEVLIMALEALKKERQSYGYEIAYAMSDTEVRKFRLNVSNHSVETRYEHMITVDGKDRLNASEWTNQIKVEFFPLLFKYVDDLHEAASKVSKNQVTVVPDVESAIAPGEVVEQPNQNAPGTVNDPNRPPAVDPTENQGAVTQETEASADSQ